MLDTSWGSRAQLDRLLGCWVGASPKTMPMLAKCAKCARCAKYAKWVKLAKCAKWEKWAKSAK